MTTDITELAQSLKAAAPNVTPGPWVVKDYFWLTPKSEVFSGEFVECHNGPDAQYLKLLSPENMLNLLAERDADKAIIAKMARLIAEMEFASTEKANRIAELVEALEKAQRHANLTEEERQAYLGLISKRDERIAEQEEAEQKLCAANVTLDARAELAERRLAELESRTVKMPEPFKLAKSSSGLTYYYADEVNEALSAAGIKLEAE
ncbi:Uncharacterised protein [Raoultella planticola]|uniref:hypothetical protein n=1 Tax=Raoultella planticola TaxID=575 RepID=UPI000D8BB7A0|nr:hypothetical protein [Raoultella planticola]SPZ32141.1 Uncharacterised protein [Raoultella planticola]